MKIVKMLSFSILMSLSVASVNAMVDPQEKLDDAIKNSVKKKDVSLIQAELNKGASVNKTYKGVYPLIRAVTFGDPYIVQFLVDKSALVNVVDSQKMTPLHHAAARKDDKILKLLLQNNASVDFKDTDGETALHVAAKYGNLDDVKDLIKAAPSLIMEVDKDGNTAYDLAKKFNRKEVVDYLEEF